MVIFRHDDFTKPYYALRRGEDGARGRLRTGSSRSSTPLLASAPWLGGAAYGLADIAYVPWVLRARDLLGVALEPYPALRGWLARLLERGRRSPPRPGSWPRCDARAADFPRVVDAAWLAEHLGEDDLVVGDVRGPNAHMRGHIPGSRPLVLGSPPPGADEATAHELAKEIALRLRRHGITGEERLVLVDRGDGVGAMPAAQLAELAGHPRVAILLGGLAGWDGRARGRAGRARAGARGIARAEPARAADAAGARRRGSTTRVADVLLDVRTRGRVHGPPRQPLRSAAGPHPGRAERRRRRRSSPGPAAPLPAERIRELVGLPEGAEIVAYCHSGSRSALATLALRSAGYDARNYAGSWHEWSRHPELPLER